MKRTFQKQLLVAAISAAVANTALSANHNLGGAAGHWASAGGLGQADTANALAGDNVDINGRILTVKNDGNANDSSGLDAFSIGDIDSGAANGDVIVTTERGVGNNLTVTIGSVAAQVQNMTISEANGHAADITTNVTGDLTLAGNLTVGGNNNAGQASSVTFSVGGDTDVTGNIDIAGNKDVSATFQGDVAGAIRIGQNNANNPTHTVTFDASANDIAVANAVTKTDAAPTANVVIMGGNTVTANGIWGGAANVLDSVSLQDGSNLTLAAALSATDVTVGNGATLDIAGQTVTGAIGVTGGTLAAANNGTVTGLVTFNGNSAMTVANGDTVDLAGGATLNDDGSQLTVNGTLNGGAVTLNNASTLTVGDNGTVTGAVTFNGSNALTVANGETATLTNGITLNGAASQLTVDGTLNGGAVALTGGTLTVGDGGIIQGAVTLGGASRSTVGDGANLQGAVNLGGTSMMTMAAAANAGGITLADDSQLVLGAGNLTSAVTFNSADSTVSMADGGTITGAVNANAIDQGSLNFFGAGIVTGNIGAGNNLAAISLLGSNKTVAVTGDIVAANTNNIGDNRLTATGTFDVGADQKLQFTLTGDEDTSGRIEAGGNVTVDADTIVHLDADIGDNVNINDDGTIDSITLIDGTTAAAGTVGRLNNVIGDSSLRLKFVQNASADSLIVDVEVETTNASLLSGNNARMGAVLDALQELGGNAIDSALLGVIGNSLKASTVSELNNLMGSLQAAPPSAGAAVAAGVSSQVQGQAARRVAYLRNDSNNQGINAGNPLAGAHVWGQFFGNKIDQDTRDNVAGYDADTTGAMLGIDTGEYWNDRTVGLALSYARTKVDYETRNTSKSEIDSIQLTAYGDYNLSNTAFLTGMLGYAHNDIETTRRNVGNVAGRTAKGDTDGQQYSASLELGNDFHLNAAGGMTITPSILASYSHISQDKYTETGAEGTSLVVDVDSSEIFDLGLNLEMAWQHEMRDGSTLEPTIHLGYKYDLIADEVESTSRFTGGGASFKTEGLKPKRSTYNAGVGLALFSGDHWEVSGGYDFEYKDGYKGHSGSIKATYKF